MPTVWFSEEIHFWLQTLDCKHISIYICQRTHAWVFEAKLCCTLQFQGESSWSEKIDCFSTVHSKSVFANRWPTAVREQFDLKSKKCNANKTGSLCRRRTLACNRLEWHRCWTVDLCTPSFWLAFFECNKLNFFSKFDSIYFPVENWPWYFESLPWEKCKAFA